jgi:hypothetical protein
LSQINQGSFTPSFEAMAEKMLLEFSAPNINNICLGPTINHEFELKPSLINMVQADLFSGNMKMQALISKTFCRKAPPSPSWTFPSK